MVRGKIEMKRIENATSRQVTFSKRRKGLLKKAYELSVLCDAEVAVLIFSQKGRLCEFSSNDMQKTIERYGKHAKEVQDDRVDTEQYIQHLVSESTEMVKKIEQLEISQRKILGQDLASSSLEELQEMHSQLEKSISKIRARKDELFKEQIEKLKAKERLLLDENASYREKCSEKPWPHPTQQKEVDRYLSLSGKNSEVETQLSIGLPEPERH
ncbi:MADS-box protein AGL42 isoform X1 [Hevea brasiliensis]|nr:MADS-box protein AGL42 isoform X1 [Hevea brasiliensis]